MKLSVSAYRAHASAHKKILDTAYQLNYGSTSASHHATSAGTSVTTSTTCAGFQIDPPSGDQNGTGEGMMGDADDGSSDDANTPLQSPKSQNTSREEDESSNANESDCKSPSQRTKSNQRWMKLRTTVQISSAIQKKPPLKREDSFLKRFSTRQIPEAQETVEDTGSEGAPGDSKAPRRRRRFRKQPRTVVNPDENFYFYWLLILTICVLYNMWTLIVRQSFPELQQLISGFWLLCDSLSDVFFILDVGVQLRTGYLEQGLMVYDSKKLAKHYLRSRAFLLDLAALSPLDLLQIRFGPQPLLRCPRFLKVYRAVNYYYMVESRTVYPNLWRVVNLIHILLILAHWFGCFYFLLSEAEGFQGDWVYPYRPGDYATLTRKYLGSLYWSTLTLTTIGDLPTPETNAEKTDSVDGPRSLPRRGVKSRLLQFNTNGGYVFTIVSYLIGVFIFATIVGQVGNVITNRNANRLEFERLLDGAKTYMRHHKVPGGMKRRVLRWYDYSWSRGRIQGGGDINTALGLLPDKLKTELALHVNLSVLKKVTIFQECQPEFLRDLVLKMKAYIFTPGDSICRKGEVAREMFIIADGILEVLSEAGKVLTSMKAGDFFGEIGILNLDGLNKRTADVRSVGYSELFSLSREDVLAAMKDYPEAQEILQALGRKRLMEVKASARQAIKEHKSHHSTAHGPDAKKFVDKIKNEAKGLRNVLRKSRTHRRSQESLELQPLNATSANTKGMLKRMSRVKSHDLSQEENTTTIDQHQNEAKVPSPLGAGLPLLHRLRLLKEKQENEERERLASSAAASAMSPPIHSTSPSSLKSPPPITEEPPQEPPEPPEPPEPIGAGLPLLQRLLLLKKKEEETPTPPCSLPTSPTSSSQTITQTTSKNLQSSVPRLSLHPRSSITKLNQSAAAATTTTSSSSTLTTTTPTLKPTNKLSFKERLKLHTTKDHNSVKDSAIQPSTHHHQQHHHHLQQQQQTSASESSESNNKNEPHWSKLKKAAISCESTTTTITATTQSKETTSTNTDEPKEIKPKLILTNKTKQYRSIDDLSPEYGGLPFVKKLKILNERQKLEELELVMKTRSFSLDIPDTQTNVESENLTRSHSEGSKMHQDRNNKNNLLCAQLVPSSLHSSSESNETLERRNLKSILKKLSEDTQTTSPLSSMPERCDSQEFRKLMRAPTIEGYAARHSKLSKSVTFNRDTLQSPPNSANILGTTQNLFPFVSVPTGNGIYDVTHEEDAKRQELEKCGLQFISATKNSQMKFFKGSLEEDQQYFNDILIAIKQVMNSHIQEIQEKFQMRFEKLEDEVKNREETINKLKARIFELERIAEDSFTDSMETIIDRQHQSWEDTNLEESIELQDLPRTLKPQQIWPSETSSPSVVLELDSNTDTESDQNDSSEPGGYESSEYENIGSSGNNWEIEMLAAQIRERRSASLDHNINKPIKKLFNRAGSMDHKKD